MRGNHKGGKRAPFVDRAKRFLSLRYRQGNRMIKVKFN